MRHETSFFSREKSDVWILPGDGRFPSLKVVPFQFAISSTTAFYILILSIIPFLEDLGHPAQC